MSDTGHYPPPDFSCPLPNTFQQQQPKTSSFHPGMWSWQETPSETSWGYSTTGYSNYNGATANYGSQSARGGYGTNAQGYHQWQQGRGRGGRQHYGSYGKKNKKEPEYSYFCDTCDRGFKNTEKYNEHMSQHVKCSVPDCTFMAHEKIVSIHWKNNHAHGTKRIKLDTPEEIAKWREERRKNYPTRENVEKKKKMIEMREETGGVLETAQFGRMRGRGRGCGKGRGWGNRSSRSYQGHYLASKGNSTAKSQTPTKINRVGDPLGTLTCGDLDSDKEDWACESKKVVVAPKQMSSALGSLMTNYGSMSESEDEPDTAPIQKVQELRQDNQTILNTIPTKSQDSAAAFNAGRHDHRGGRRGRGKRGRGRSQDTPQKRRPTLLEMLLAPDIRHERNVLLQCVRYVVRNNFFGLESKQKGNTKPINKADEDHSEDVDMSGCFSSVEGVKAETFCDSEEKKMNNGLDNDDNHVVTEVNYCILQSSAAVVQGLIDCSAQSSCPSVITIVNCPEKSQQNALELSQNINTPPIIGHKEENKSSCHIYDDEIWENGLN